MLFFRTFATVSPSASHIWRLHITPAPRLGSWQMRTALDCFYSWMMSSKKT